MKSQKFPIYLFPVIFSMSVLFAGTDGTVRGKISDTDQRPLPGAMIYFPELETGAIADPNGNYIILNIQEHNPNADLNGDDEINIADIILLVEWILEQ